MTKESIDIAVGRGGDEGALKWWFVLSGLSLSLHKSCCSLRRPLPLAATREAREAPDTPLPTAFSGSGFTLMAPPGGGARPLLLFFELGGGQDKRQALKALGLGTGWG